MRLSPQGRTRCAWPLLLVSIAGLLAIAPAAAPASATPDIAMTWGFNGEGQLGDGAEQAQSDVPVQVSGLGAVKAISSGEGFELALLDDGAVMAWGENAQFQLGDGTTTEDSTVPVQVSGLRRDRVRAIAAGGTHSLALLSSGKVMAWGENEDGQLGDGEAGRAGREGISHEQQGPFGTDMRFVTLDSWSGTVDGREYSVYAGAAVRPASGVATRSELVVFDDPSPRGYDGTFAPPGGGRKALRIVSAHGDILDVSTSAGALLSFDVARRSFVAHHQYGRLGDVPVEVRLAPRAVTALAAGGDFSLGLLRDGTVVAWGENEDGQLGEGTNSGPERCSVERTACSRTPARVGALSGVTAIAAGEGFGLARLKTGTVMAWGENESGELGDGSAAEQSGVPVPVRGLAGVSAIAAGAHHALALLENGTVMAWGSNQSGQLGDGSAAEQSDVPVAVSALSGVRAIAAGEGFSLALLDSGRVMAWGEDVNGELGDGEAEGEQSDVPVPVSGLREVAGIAAGGADGLAFGPGPVLAPAAASNTEGRPARDASIIADGLTLATAANLALD